MSEHSAEALKAATDMDALVEAVCEIFDRFLTEHHPMDVIARTTVIASAIEVSCIYGNAFMMPPEALTAMTGKYYGKIKQLGEMKNDQQQ